MTIYYSTSEDAESFSATSPHEAVLEMLESRDAPGGPTVWVYAWRPVPRPEKPLLTHTEILAYLASEIETAYEGLVHPEEPYDIPPAVSDAARALAEAIRATLPIWHCERVPEHDTVVEIGPTGKIRGDQG